MALNTVSAGDIAEIEDINQFVSFLNLVNGNSTLIKTLSGSISSTNAATLAHGLGRVPFSLIGFWSTSSQAGADAGIQTIHPINSTTTNAVYFRNGSSVSATSKSADDTNIYVYNPGLSSIFYRIYYI